MRDNLRVKEIHLDSTDIRFVICHNPDQALRDQTQRDEAIARITAELARIAEQRTRDAQRPKDDRTRARNEAAHVRAECALRDHPTLGRWLTQQANGRLKVNAGKVKAEARLDGKYLIATSDPHISAEDTALGYKNLLEAERGFRDLKTQLLLRPVFHRLEHRIRAHVLICWPALLLTRVAERGSGETWRNINRQLGRITQVALAGPAGTVTQTTPLNPTRRPSTRHFPFSRQPGSPPSTPAEHHQPRPGRRRHTPPPGPTGVLAAQAPNSDPRVTTNCGTPDTPRFVIGVGGVTPN